MSVLQWFISMNRDRRFQKTNLESILIIKITYVGSKFIEIITF